MTCAIAQLVDYVRILDNDYNNNNNKEKKQTHIHTVKQKVLFDRYE